MSCATRSEAQFVSAGPYMRSHSACLLPSFAWRILSRIESATPRRSYGVGHQELDDMHSSTIADIVIPVSFAHRCNAFASASTPARSFGKLLQAENAWISSIAGFSWTLASFLRLV